MATRIRVQTMYDTTPPTERTRIDKRDRNPTGD